MDTAQEIDYHTLPASELLARLETAGRLPDLALIRACLARPAELTPTLLQWLAEEPPADWPGDDPRWYKAVHAGLLLIAYREPAALPLFAAIYRDEQREDLIEWFGVELPSYGPALTDWALELLNDPRAWEYGRIAATEILASIGWHHPAERARIVSALVALLPALGSDGAPVMPPGYRGDEDAIWTWAAYALAQLRDTASQPQVVALYEHGLMDEMVMGDVDHYLAQLAPDARPPLASYRDFDILRTYEGLHAMAQRERELMAMSQQRAAARPTSPPMPPAVASGATQPFVRSTPKIGRNEPCPCGSGKKYKHCHGKKA
jgi:hypothetical protein